jgi:hypothetical protein
VGVSDAHAGTDSQFSPKQPAPTARPVRAGLSNPTFSEPQPRFCLLSVSVTTSQAGCEAAEEPGLLLIRTPQFGGLVELPQTSDTYSATSPFRTTSTAPRNWPSSAPVPAPTPPPEKAAEGRGAARAGPVGARIPASRARAAGAARPHLPCEAPATHPNNVPLRPSRRHGHLFRWPRSSLVATTPSAAAVTAVLVAAVAAAARVRLHAHRRGRARALRAGVT